MARIWKPAVFFLLALILALAINMPVAFILGFVQLPNNIKVYNPQGTLLSGHVRGLELNQFLIRDLEYDAKLSCLFNLSLCYQISNSYGSLLARYLPLSLNSELTQVDIEFPLEDLDNIPGGLLVQPKGSLQLKLDKVLLVQDKLAELTGMVVWVDAGIVGEDINLGDYELSLNKGKGTYDLTIEDRDALLDISGKGDLKSNGQYTLDIKIGTKSSLDPRIKNALELVARKQGINQYVVARKGKLDARLMNQLIF